MDMPNSDIILKIPLENQFITSILPVFKVFSEQEIMEKKRAFKFQLIAEEFLLYFQQLFQSEIIEIRLFKNGKYCSIQFTIRQKEIDLSGLNLVNLYGNGWDGDELQSDLGLLLIARSVDKLDVFIPDADSCTIEASFERFSAVSAFRGHYQQMMPPFHIVLDKNTLLSCLQLSGSIYPDLQSEFYFSRPEGFLADCAIEKAGYLCVVDQRKVPGAFLYWQVEHGTVIFFGPYVLTDNDKETVAQYAIDQFLSKIGKENCYCVLSKKDLPASCRLYFDELNGIYYRNMMEDKGGIVWSSSEMMPILQRAFNDLDFSRNILLARFMPVQEKSLIRTMIDKEHSTIEMIPLIIGRDFARLIRAHADTLSEKPGYRITISLYLNDMLQAAAMDFAEQCGFSFYYFLPGEGIADKVVMKYDAHV